MTTMKLLNHHRRLPLVLQSLRPSNTPGMEHEDEEKDTDEETAEP